MDEGKLIQNGNLENERKASGENNDKVQAVNTNHEPSQD